ncbi:hypothetical protein Thiowin_02061 [Thiorhodovibrio winogradskyi]|uniref:Uncharacterized protein n=1 Tax=Thiorhodovibrio winogradskyi TaxID=77007 RepID=A0ABZ0S7V1_9GAMM|nr:hypothetical protein [Thiorhodovibrio winogradskyi]
MPTLPTTSRKPPRCLGIKQLPRTHQGPSMLTSVVIVGLMLAGLLWLPPAESLTSQWPALTLGLHP